jgi:ribonuclease/clavin/mitogillin
MLRPQTIRPTIERFAAETPTLAPATHTNSYALGGRDVLLVEPATPYEAEQREWLAWARALASQGREILGIVPTHHHPDHVGGAAFLASEVGAPLWAHEATRSRIQAPVARLLEDGDEIVLRSQESDEVWCVLHTPGHAPGHICLFERSSRIAVVGDMIASVGTILIAPGDGDLCVYLAQLKRLADLDATLALPAHGDPVDTPTATFLRYIEHRNKREERILAALTELSRTATGDATPLELVRVAYADVPEYVWPIAKLSVETHLEKLEREGKIQASTREGAFRPSPAESRTSSPGTP